MASSTKAQRDKVLRLLATGEPVYLVARELGIDPRTVATYKQMYSGLILSYQREQAGLNIDGTPKRSIEEYRKPITQEKIDQAYQHCIETLKPALEIITQEVTSIITPKEQPLEGTVDQTYDRVISSLDIDSVHKKVPKKRDNILSKKEDGLYTGKHTEMEYRLLVGDKGVQCCQLADIDGEWDYVQLDKLHRELGELLHLMRKERAS